MYVLSLDHTIILQNLKMKSFVYQIKLFVSEPLMKVKSLVRDFTL
jgi:hypothetical protein